MNRAQTLSARHMLEMRREEINVTSSYRPDTNWRYVDQQGHTHIWQERTKAGELIVVGEYDPAKTYVVSSLRYVVDVPETDEYPEEGHHVCMQCGECVRIGYTADDIDRYILGAISYYCDGEQISKETFDRLVQEEFDRQ